MDDLKYHVAFSQISRLGSKKFKQLKNFFPDIKTAWSAGQAELLRAGLDEKMVEEIVLVRRDINPDLEMEKLQKENVNVVALEDKRYPKLLKEIHLPPFILYYKGDLTNLNEQALAVVGTRKISAYGKIVTEQIVGDLSNQELIIVSGLAEGIDSVAHRSALQNKKTTVSVLGSGLARENIYPSFNRQLVDRILENNGLIVSEFPLNMMPLRHNFPIRNRIISGLSLGTLVIEAGESSGALITAAFALEQNREVFAIPGSITSPMSIGTNNLIKRGAKLVQTASDILEELNLKELKQFKAAEAAIPASPEEATITKHLEFEPLHINEIMKRTDLSMQEVNATLTLLEIKGRIRNLGNCTYFIKK
jgi:DNA processing protein